MAHPADKVTATTYASMYKDGAHLSPRVVKKVSRDNLRVAHHQAFRDRLEAGRTNERRLTARLSSAIANATGVGIAMSALYASSTPSAEN